MDISATGLMMVARESLAEPFLAKSGQRLRVLLRVQAMTHTKHQLGILSALASGHLPFDP